MILTRSPLRISIGGGGTDLPSFYEHNGTQFSSLAIDKFVYVSVFKRFYKNHLIKYRITEEVENYKQIVRELSSYDKKLSEKREIIVFNKSDLLKSDEIKKKLDNFKRRIETKYEIVSVFSNKDIQKIKKKLIKYAN